MVDGSLKTVALAVALPYLWIRGHRRRNKCKLKTVQICQSIHVAPIEPFRRSVASHWPIDRLTYSTKKEETFRSDNVWKNLVSVDFWQSPASLLPPGSVGGNWSEIFNKVGEKLRSWWNCLLMTWLQKFTETFRLLYQEYCFYCKIIKLFEDLQWVALTSKDY